MSIYKKIYKKIKKASKIVIARHIGPDPDALGSSIGLKEIIKNTFPKKEVYVIGAPTNKFKFIGLIDKYDETMNDALLIVTDTPNAARIDGVELKQFKDSIKIDHHPFVEKMCSLEWIDDKSSSASEMIVELVLNTKLKMNKIAAEKLFIGLVSDTNRFMFSSTSVNTFDASAYLITFGINITQIYNDLYERPFKELVFHGYLSSNLKLTEHGVGYIIVNTETLNEYRVDAAVPGNMVNDFNFIKEMPIWCTCTYDENNNYYRVSIRSKNIVINDIVEDFNGGGHRFACGTKLKEIEDFYLLIQKLDERLGKLSDN